MVLELPILDNLDGFVRSDFFTCHISLTKILLRMFLPYVFLWLDMLVFRRVIHSNNMWGDHDSWDHIIDWPSLVPALSTVQGIPPRSKQKGHLVTCITMNINPTKRSQHSRSGWHTLDFETKNRSGFEAPMVESKTVRMFSVKWHTIQMTFLFEAKHQGGLFWNPNK